MVKVNEYYDSIASGYSELHENEQLEKLSIVHKLLNSDPKISSDSKLFLFDVGCGTGISTIGFGCTRAGLDPAINLLKLANDQRMDYKKVISNSIQNQAQHNVSPPNTNVSKHLGYVRGIAEKLPIKTKKCDIVISITVIHNLDDFKAGLLEIKRITKQRTIISILKKTKKFSKIIEMINNHFQVLATAEDQFDYFLYLCPK